jgi:serine/threonine-protein kinase
METHEEPRSPAFEPRRSMPAVGDIIADKYRIEAVLGRGGMSVVYRATHLHLDQQVAIKVLSTEALLFPEYVVRLKREARAVSRIRSEHVVRVHDIGELSPGGVPYLVMECLSGLDLAAVLARRGPFPVELAVECVLQACEALAEAHALGIIHRDLKPANLFLTEAVDGSACVKVVDFGISRMCRAGSGGLSALTDPGTALGTPSYMAPEQMEASASVDARSDIWALGTILFELLVGKPPYSGQSLPQIFMKIMRSPPPSVSALRSDVPKVVDAIIARCLRVDAKDRFRSVAELAWALSTAGTPRARDSAERITRVFEHLTTDERAAGVVSPTLRSSASPLAMKTLDSGSQRRPSAAGGGWGMKGRIAAAFATVGLLGGLSAFGVFAANGAIDAGAPQTPEHPPRALAVAAPFEDAAVIISPAHRPAPLAPSRIPPPPFLRGPATPQAPRPAPPPAGVTHAAFVAVSLPAPPPAPDRPDAAAAVAAVPED